MVRSSTVNAVVTLVVLAIGIYIFMIFVNGGGLNGLINLFNRSLPQQSQQRTPAPAAPTPAPAPKQSSSKEDQEVGRNEQLFTEEGFGEPTSTCDCPQKPTCNAFCNSPETFKFCCFGKIVTGNIAKLAIA